MAGLDDWRVCDELSVVQAALLVAGCDPSTELVNVEQWAVHERPAGYEAARTALVNAINGGRLIATVRHNARKYGWAERQEAMAPRRIDDAQAYSEAHKHERLSAKEEFIYEVEPDWTLTTVRVDYLREWFALGSARPAFFFPDNIETVEYLSPDHPRYAPKLAAAVRAWQAVTDPKGKHPRQALEKWLRDHAGQFPLTKGGESLTENAIDECASVANWRLSGGAPKTPERNPGT